MVGQAGDWVARTIVFPAGQSYPHRRRRPAGECGLQESVFTVVGPCDLSTLTALLDDLQANGLITQRDIY